MQSFILEFVPFQDFKSAHWLGASKTLTYFGQLIVQVSELVGLEPKIRFLTCFTQITGA